MGDHAAALSLATECLAIERERGEPPRLAEALALLAELALARGEVPLAARLLGAADALAASMGLGWAREACAAWGDLVARLRAVADPAGWDAPWTEGHGMTLEAALDLARAPSAGADA